MIVRPPLIEISGVYFYIKAQVDEWVQDPIAIIMNSDLPRSNDSVCLFKVKEEARPTENSFPRRSDNV